MPDACIPHSPIPIPAVSRSARRCMPPLASLLLLTACHTSPSHRLPDRATTLQPPAADAAMRALADDYVAALLQSDPMQAYLAGIETETHDRLEDRSLTARADWQHKEDVFRQRLHTIEPASLATVPARIAHGQLRELLDASIGLRICRLPGWAGVNHMSGWHIDLPNYAAQQPVETEAQRVQALARWRALPRFVDVEIANLRTGLAQGYSMPRAVVERVLRQMQGLTATPPEESDYAAPAANSTDTAFKDTFLAVVRDDILPALQRYETFLREEYLPAARTSLAVTELPDGNACYRALLRMHTTLDRSPGAVYELGQRTVAANVRDVQARGRVLFGTDDLQQVVRRVADAPDNHFASEGELLAFSRDTNLRAREAIRPMFVQLPAQDATVEPFPPHERGSGRSSHYQPPVDGTAPGIFRINLDNWASEQRGTAEVTVAHETWPGHHLHMTLSREATWPLAKLAYNSAHVEGWGRYAERLAEEAGVYRTAYAPISRRIWPARGMVADPGIHAFGWSRERATEYLVSTGRYTVESAQGAIDRVAALPGQWTAYDSGGIEIAALRETAERELGDRFDLPGFHAAIIDDGVMPLAVLRENVQRWIEARRGDAGLEDTLPR